MMIDERERKTFEERHAKINRFEITATVMFVLLVIGVIAGAAGIAVFFGIGSGVGLLVGGGIGCVFFKVICDFFIANARNVESIHRQLFGYDKEIGSSGERDSSDDSAAADSTNQDWYGEWDPDEGSDDQSDKDTDDRGER